jgi:hypothetical protein
MPWTCAFLALTAALSLAAPLAAQIGLASSSRPVQLTAVKQGWVSVALPDSASMPLARRTGASVVAGWNVPAEHSARLTVVMRLLPAHPRDRRAGTLTVVVVTQ